MEIGNVEIIVELQNCRLSVFKINNQIFSRPIEEQSVFEQQIAYINSELFEVYIEIRGIIGSQALLTVNHLSKGALYQANLVILRNDIAKKTFIIQNSELTEKKPEDIKHLVAPTDGASERGLARTLRSPNFEVELFYATDRHVNYDQDGKSTFTSEPNGLSFGRCLVNIPGKHKLGELNRPQWWRLEFKERRDKHIMLLEQVKLEQDEFLLAVLNKISLSANNDAFIFIHGFNTSFHEGVYRTAQLAYDLGFTGAPIYYGWPSLGDVLNYPEDEKLVEGAVKPFKEFLIQLKPVLGEKKVHLVAHSMGNRLLIETLETLVNDSFFQTPVFDQIIMAAPDVDAEAFLDGPVGNVIISSKRATLYASSADRALSVSRGIHSSVIRLGESGNLITCHQGLDTIDASTTDPSMLGHGYFATTAPLISDIFNLFRFNFAPANRNLLPRVSESSETYWAFR